MTYFMPDEIWVGGTASVSELALVLPIRKHDETLLISSEEDVRWATFLDPGRQQYHSFQISGDGAGRKGLIVPGIKIEVDQTSIFDTNLEFKLGSIIRENDRISIVAQTYGAYGLTDERNVQLVDGLLDCDAGQSAGFKKWRVILGEGERKRVLWEIDLEHSESV